MGGRIWPLCYPLGVLPDQVVLAEDEEGAVDGEAVLLDGVRVVDGHGPGSLGHRLLVDPLAARSAASATAAAAPGTPSAGARSSSATSSSAAAAGWEIFREASHSGNAQIRRGKSKVVSVEMKGRRITTGTLHPSHGGSVCVCVGMEKQGALIEQQVPQLLSLHPSLGGNAKKCEKEIKFRIKMTLQQVAGRKTRFTSGTRLNPRQDER